MPAVKLSSSMVGWTPHRVEAGCCCKHMNQQTEIWDDTLTHRCLNKRETFKEIILKEILKVWHFILVFFFFHVNAVSTSISSGNVFIYVNKQTKNTKQGINCHFFSDVLIKRGEAGLTACVCFSDRVSLSF